MRRSARAAIALVVVAGTAILYSCRGTLGVAMLQRVASRTIFADTVGGLPDGFHVALCGTGSPYPDPTRAGPCTAIIAGQRLFIVDSGRGSPDVVARMGLQGSRIEAVLLTHFHSDHIDGLPQLAEQRWVAWRAKTPLVVLGPPGTERVVGGFNEAHALNDLYRTAHHGRDVADPAGAGLVARPFALPEPPSSAVVLESDDLRITAFTVNHEPVQPAVGYRFDYKGRSIVISGDTAPSPNLVRLARGVDLLVHEAISPTLLTALETTAEAAGRTEVTHIFRDPLSFHTRPWDAAQEATEAHVGALVFTHFIPGLPSRILVSPFLGDARERFAGPIYVGQDGDIFTLPIPGGALAVRNVL